MDIIFPRFSNRYRIFILFTAIALIGIIGYLIPSLRRLAPLTAITVIFLLAIYELYREKKYRDQVVNLLHQLGIEILDTGVIIFDLHARDICCGVWITEKKAQTLLGKLFSTNAKYGRSGHQQIQINEQQALTLAVKQRAQVYEKAELRRINTHPLVQYSDSLATIEPEWDWRIITPVIDAIDRLNVIGLLIIEGRGKCELVDISRSGLDKAATMIAVQICEVLSTERVV